MFSPRYTITDQLLANIKRINSLVLVNRAKPTRALDFNKLIELGLIERKGKGKATYYVLKEK